jgi:hypothetical protein
VLAGSLVFPHCGNNRQTAEAQQEADADEEEVAGKTSEAATPKHTNNRHHNSNNSHQHSRDGLTHTFFSFGSLFDSLS